MLLTIWPFVQSFVLQIAPLIVTCIVFGLWLRGKTIASNNEILARLVKEKTTQLNALALKYEAILKYAGEGIFTLTIDGRCEFVNDTSIRWLGFQRDELNNKIVHDVVHHTKKDGTPYPGEECPLYKMFTEHQYDLNSSLDDLAIRDVDFFIKKDGTFIDVEYVATPLFDYDENYIGAVLVWHPISKPKRLKKRTRSSAD